MESSEMLRHVVLVRTDVSEELSVSIIRVTGISELGTTLAITSNQHTLFGNELPVSKLSYTNLQLIDSIMLYIISLLFVK
jgi:hypothetical protein